MVMLFSLLLARYFGPEISGGYTSAYAITNLTAIAFNLGLDTWLLRAGALTQDLQKTFGDVIKIKTVAGMVWALLLFGIATKLRPDLYPAALLAVCILDIWFDSIFITSLSVMNTQRRIKQYSLFVLLSRGLKLLGLIILMITGSQTILMFAGWRAFCSFLFAFIALRFLQPNLGESSFSTLSEVFRKSRSFALSDLLATVYMQADVVILSNIRGKTAAGIYSPALSFINALFVFPNTVYAYVIPSLSRWLKKNDEKFIELARKLILLVLVMGIAMSLATAMLSRPATRILLGERFSKSGELMVRLSPMLFLKCLEFGFAAIIVAADKQKSRLIPQGIAAMLNVGLNIALIPRLGEFGAAAVYLVTEIVLFVSYGIIAFKTLKAIRRENVERT